MDKTVWSELQIWHSSWYFELIFLSYGPVFGHQYW